MCYDSTVQERRTAWRQTSSSTPPPPPRGLMPDRPPLGSPTGPRRDATRSSREWPTNPALAVCIPHSTNAVCTTRENGIQQPPTAVLAEDWIGFDPHRQRIDHTAPRMCHTLPPNNIISPTHVRRRKFFQKLMWDILISPVDNLPYLYILILSLLLIFQLYQLNLII